MTDETSAPPPASPPPAAKASPWGRIGGIVVGIAVLVLGGVKLLNLFVLPPCDATNITDTVRELFKSKEVELVTFNDVKPLSGDDKKVMCGAYVESADEKANIQYSIVWQGWSPYVTIETVDTIAPDPKPADATTQ